MKNNGKTRRAERKASAEARLKASKPCTVDDCNSVHVDQAKAHPTITEN